MGASLQKKLEKDDDYIEPKDRKNLTEGKQEVCLIEAMPNFVDKISGPIEDTLAKLNKKRFIADPIAGDHFSKIVSLFSSAYKRHGFILEKAILEGVKESKDLTAWEEKVFHVSRETDRAIGEIDDEDRLHYAEEIDIEYSDKSIRQLQVDLITYNKKTKVMNAYEIKRGNGTHDAGKKRSMLRDLLSVKFLLKSYGKKKGYDVKKVGAYIIFYY